MLLEQTLQTKQRHRREKQSGHEIDLALYEALISPQLSILDRWVRSKTPRGLSPEDIVQQTLVLAWKNFSGLRVHASVRTWLCTIALNVIRGHLRSLQSWRIVSLDSPTAELLNIDDSYPSTLKLLEEQEASDELYRVIAKLPERYRIVVELMDLQELSTEDIMNQLSLSRTALKSRHFRAKRLLLMLLKTERRHGLFSILMSNGIESKA